ncbi:unnamed protein product [Polarella glacialis]|uniref:J domain-containing protein n=1 Tax=Polarella glacialis TaxID=89957 RepID=A0A813INX4_POLGL|nr:unnamed protein product [Polarella glacialis]
MPGPIQFVDHYAVIGCSPETPVDEIKKAYHEKLREFHPDKRPWSAGGGHGQKVTQALTEAWEALRFPALRGAYDILWQRERRTTSSRPTPLSPPQERACAPPEQSPWERAELCRREGNDLYKRAQALMKQAGDGADSLSIRMQAMQAFQATIEKYSHGLKLAPQPPAVEQPRPVPRLAQRVGQLPRGRHPCDAAQARLRQRLVFVGQGNVERRFSSCGSAPDRGFAACRAGHLRPSGTSGGNSEAGEGL